jgi:hypothetical protein
MTVRGTSRAVRDTFATLTDERLDEMIRALEANTKAEQSALHAARMEQRRRRRRAREMQQA